MKKFKLFNILLIMIMVLAMPVVYAHDVTLAGDDIIPIPDQLSSSTKIEVAESFGEYKLYYQWVAMDESDYESYSELLEAQLAVPNPGTNASQEEKEAYDEAVLGYEASKNALKPGYVESDWVESKDGTVPFNKNLEGVENEDPYILWIKVVSTTNETNVIFEERLILYSSDLKQEENVENAETSDSILVIGVLTVAAVGLMAVSYKKSRA